MLDCCAPGDARALVTVGRVTIPASISILLLLGCRVGAQVVDTMLFVIAASLAAASLLAPAVSAKAPVLDLWSGPVSVAHGRLGRSLLLRDAPSDSYPQVLVAVFADDDALVGGWSSSLKAAGAVVLSFLPK